MVIGIISHIDLGCSVIFTHYVVELQFVDRINEKPNDVLVILPVSKNCDVFPFTKKIIDPSVLALILSNKVSILSAFPAIRNFLNRNEIKIQTSVLLWFYPTGYI